MLIYRVLQMLLTIWSSFDTWWEGTDINILIVLAGRHVSVGVRAIEKAHMESSVKLTQAGS